MTLLELARKLRPYIEKAAISLTDEDALEAVNLFPNWQEDTAYMVDQRVRYNNILYKCLTAHVSQSSWMPDVSPSLWARVLIPDENVIPEWEQPDSTNAYKIGDKVMFEGQVYESVINNNIWSPAAYPAGWQLVNT